MNRTEARGDLIRLLCIVFAFPALVGLVWDNWPAISAWARSPASPWVLVFGFAVAVALFAGVVLWDAVRRRPHDCQRECCADWRREGGR